MGSHSVTGISLLFIYNNNRISQSKVRNQKNYLQFLLKLVSFQGLHLHEGGDGDSLIRGELGVLGGLEKILNINPVKDWCDTYIISLESEVITGTTCYGQETRSRGAALTSTLAPITVLVNDLKHIRVLKT